MSHDPEIERALAELAELSRRVADLAATVSALAARRERSSGNLAVMGSTAGDLPPSEVQAQPSATLPAMPHWIPWQPTTGASGPPQSIAFQPIFLTPSQTASLFPSSLGTDAVTAVTDASAAPAAAQTALAQNPAPTVSPERPATTDSRGGRTSVGKRKTRRRKPAAQSTSTGWSRLVATRRKRTAATSPAVRQPPGSPPRPHDSARRRLGPLSVSVALHAAALVALATVFIVRESDPEPMVITSSVTAEEPAETFTEVDIEPVELTDSVAEEMEPVVPNLAELDMAAAIDETALATEITAPAAESLLTDAAVSGPSTADLLAPLGIGAGNSGGGGTSGEGMAGGGAMFFGKAGSGTSVCFMCDNSRSYEDGGFEMVVTELMRAVASLQPNQYFFVVFFSDEAYPMFYPDEVSELLPATPENKQKLQTWLTNVETRTGGRGIGRATELATSLEADTIYFLSDGDYSPTTVARLISSDFGGAVVHTFGMQAAARRNPTPEQIQEQLSHNQNLIRVAESHGGSFTPVITPPQAAAAARMRAAAGP